MMTEGVAGRRRRGCERWAGILDSHAEKRGIFKRLLRVETMRSGRSRSKINCRNLHSDREISLTMRALVRAKWSEVGGCLGAWRLDLERGKSWKKDE